MWKLEETNKVNTNPTKNSTTKSMFGK